MSSKSHMKFDNFQNYTYKAQYEMRNNEFCDVTLVDADNKKFVAHKVVLAGCSTFFKNMLLGEKHPHPVIFMRGVEHDVLNALLEVIYCGETSIEKEHINSFVTLCTEIELFGVTKEALEKENSMRYDKQKERKGSCKYWNKGFCKQSNCPYIHSEKDCEEHALGKACKEKSCHKRHRKTCRYWHQGKCFRKGDCAYLHRETYKSRMRDRSEISEGRSRKDMSSARSRTWSESSESKESSYSSAARRERRDRIEKGDSRNKSKSIESYRRRFPSTDNGGDRKESRERSANEDIGSRSESRDGESPIGQTRRHSKERARSRSSSFDMSRLEEYER